MLEVTIDGKKIEVEEGTILIDAARKLGVDIPVLCFHPAITPYGSCRVCSVEVKLGKRTRIVTSCNYPIRQEMEVSTTSDRVKSLRKLLFELMLARSPKVPMLQKMAAKYGATEARFELEDDSCILCGKCVQVCDQVLGIAAIDFSGRGVEEVVGTPYGESSHACIGCGACDFVCPTKCIGLWEKDGVRTLKKWNTQHELILCEDCGAPVVTKAQKEYLQKRYNVEDSVYNTCTECKRKHYASRVAAEGHM
jgi:bidirectional [NiFe] hydrogenase diaphorase subunit